ncbi:MAG: hypothetical protein HKN12_02200, partial [Gemmatimonadetes bacterium]|nr:hypothetical protein [Gemmatimonadota bacterium]
MNPSARQHIAIALVSFAVLFYQIGITRVLSVVLWYHFAFLAISLALLGVGAPGVWFALRKNGVGKAGDGARPDADRGLAGVLLAGGVAVPLSVIAITKGMALVRGANDVRDTGGGFLDAPVLLTIGTILVPFLLLGAAVCLLLLRAQGRRVTTMYGADLLGATLGAVVVVPLMHIFPTPVMLAASGLLPLAAAALVSPRRVLPAVAGIVLVATMIWGEPYQLRHTKKYDEARAVLYE